MSSNCSAVHIADFYTDKTIFITGGTGFVGKVLLEKLLRACPGISRIYLLIRPKRDQQAQERLQQLLCSPLFDSVRKERPGDLSKVRAIEGDITQPELAIAPLDIALLTSSVNVVFHSAATVKFDEKLKLSVAINMLGTQRLVELCKKMDRLECLVHVSTAYCNCDRDEVKEMVYPPSIRPDIVTSLVDMLDEDLVDFLTMKLIGNRPNTYTFTKALAESWIKENKGDLPLVIVRPSIVISSINGPLQGWVDNWHGPTGIVAALGKGLYRAILCDSDKTVDLVPVDMVINLMIVAAWSVGTTASTDIQIYNCCTGQQKPIKWKDFIDMCFKYTRKHPFPQILWYPGGTITASRTLNLISWYLVQWLPAYILDLLVWLAGGKPIMLKVQEKLWKAVTCVNYFALNQWRFDNENVRALAKTLSDDDRKQFCFDVVEIDWETYIENYVLGIRRFLFKKDNSTLPKARQQVKRLYWSHSLTQFTLVVCLWQLLVISITFLW
ncbi:hypothetical protein NQ315_000267 [Exocentrus adspersus]|uniref:Fatty acyl-CoA reductase n=1 Tax=Exocentrus adspersus TaxID=1586481 RepID=A0AAV8VQK6_9CUCU|nr:hypothetical protein NQ315_000267 [Exocentrus adspersus]